VLLSRAISLSQLRGDICFLLNVCFSSAQNRYTAYLNTFALSYFGQLLNLGQGHHGRLPAIDFTSLLFTSPVAQGFKGVIF
jgi:hypothetical protein